jgi:hypothetical protein
MAAFCEDHFKEDGQLPLRSLAAEIRLLEVRQRSYPAALDDRRSLVLINGLFFAWYHAQRPPFPREAPQRALQTLIVTLLIQGGFDEAIFLHSVRTLAGFLKTDLRRLVLLRKAAILEYIVAGDFGERDWNAELSPERLSARFEVPIGQNVQLAKFTLGGLPTRESPDPMFLPKSFFGFARPPYNVDFSDYHDLAVCLVTGDLVRLDDPLIHGDRTRETASCTFRPLLMVRGEWANLGLLCAFNWRTRLEFGPLYVDGFGDPDSGLRQGTVLALSEEMVAKEVDSLLSHAWTDRVV